MFNHADTSKVRADDVFRDPTINPVREGSSTIISSQTMSIILALPISTWIERSRDTISCLKLWIYLARISAGREVKTSIYKVYLPTQRSPDLQSQCQLWLKLSRPICTCNEAWYPPQDDDGKICGKTKMWMIGLKELQGSGSSFESVYVASSVKVMRKANIDH